MSVSKKKPKNSDKDKKNISDKPTSELDDDYERVDIYDVYERVDIDVEDLPDGSW